MPFRPLTQHPCNSDQNIATIALNKTPTKRRQHYSKYASHNPCKPFTSERGKSSADPTVNQYSPQGKRVHNNTPQAPSICRNSSWSNSASKFQKQQVPRELHNPGGGDGGNLADPIEAIVPELPVQWIYRRVSTNSPDKNRNSHSVRLKFPNYGINL